jgi:hypothetical protein
MSVLTYRRIGTCRESDRGPSEESEKRAADCAPCADSNSTLKEQIEKLDNRELVEDKERPYDRTDDDKSIDLTMTNNPVEEKFDSGQIS